MDEPKLPPESWKQDAAFWRNAYETLRASTMHCAVCGTMTRLVDCHTGRVVEDRFAKDRPQEQKTLNIADACVRLGEPK